MNGYDYLVNDESFNGIVIVLDNNSNIIKVNNSLLNLLDFSNESLKGKNIVELIVPSERTLFLDLVYTQDVSNTVTLKFYHKSGAYRFFSISVLNLDEHRVVIGTSVKKEYLTTKYEFINENIKNIDMLFKNIEADDMRELITFENNPLSLILNLLPVEVWIKDKLGKYVFVNETFALSTKKTIEEMYLKDDFQIFDEEVARSFTETDLQAIKLAKKLSFSFEVNHLNLGVFSEVSKIPIYNNKGMYIGILGFSIDVTHEKKTESRLEKETARLKYILENIDGLIFEIDPSGEVLFMSGKLIKTFEFEHNESEIVNIFSSRFSSPELSEKIRLALGGTFTEIKSTISGHNIIFKFNPVRNSVGSYNIIGIGNTI